jgi:hypothetical protein
MGAAGCCVDLLCLGVSENQNSVVNPINIKNHSQIITMNGWDLNDSQMVGLWYWVADII